MKKPIRLNRRSFLGGAGATVSLPLLEAMIPGGRSAFAQTDRPVRMIGYFVPNGIHMQSWTPRDEGANFNLTPTLMPLAPVKEYITVLTGLANRAGEPDRIGDHAAGIGAFLTCFHVRKNLGDNILNSISMDQIAAQQIGHLTPLPSLELGMFGGGAQGNCDNGYGCVYARNISWSGPKTPVPKLADPRQVFDRLFAGFDPDRTSTEGQKRRMLDKSLLDYVLADIQKLQQQLGAGDRAKLDEYFTSVRQVESRLDAEPNDTVSCEFPSRPGDGYSLTAKARLMADLMVLAFQCDITRISTFMMGNALADTRYDFLGIPDGHHFISHHGGRQRNYDMLKQIDHWEVQQFAYLLNKLKQTTDPEGVPLLESTQAFFSSDISDGNRHNHFDMPVLLAGRANGYFNTGRHVRYRNEQPWGNLFMAMLDAMGTPVAQIGQDGRSILPNLRA